MRFITAVFAAACVAAVLIPVGLSDQGKRVGGGNCIDDNVKTLIAHNLIPANVSIGQLRKDGLLPHTADGIQWVAPGVLHTASGRGTCRAWQHWAPGLKTTVTVVSDPSAPNCVLINGVQLCAPAGATGPAGAAGATGATGATGPAGTNGTNGTSFEGFDSCGETKGHYCVKVPIKGVGIMNLWYDKDEK
jgi:hypothetical protein